MPCCNWLTNQRLSIPSKKLLPAAAIWWGIPSAAPMSTSRLTLKRSINPRVRKRLTVVALEKELPTQRRVFRHVAYHEDEDELPLACHLADLLHVQTLAKVPLRGIEQVTYSLSALTLKLSGFPSAAGPTSIVAMQQVK